MVTYTSGIDEHVKAPMRFHDLGDQTVDTSFVPYIDGVRDRFDAASLRHRPIHVAA